MKCPDCGAANIAGSDECVECAAPLTNAADLHPKRGMEKRILEGTAKNLSPKPARTIAPQDSLAKAVEAMRQANIGCVLVVEGKDLVGILSERDFILKAPETLDLAKTKASELMRPRPTCLREDDEVALVFHQMALSAHWHVPLRMNDGSYGVVSARDLLRYLCK